MKWRFIRLTVYSLNLARFLCDHFYVSSYVHTYVIPNLISNWFCTLIIFIVGFSAINITFRFKYFCYTYIQNLIFTIFLFIPPSVIFPLGSGNIFSFPGENLQFETYLFELKLCMYYSKTGFDSIIKNYLYKKLFYIRPYTLRNI